MHAFIQYVGTHYKHCPEALQDFARRVQEQNPKEEPDLVNLWEEVKLDHVEEVFGSRGLVPA